MYRVGRDLVQVELVKALPCIGIVEGRQHPVLSPRPAADEITLRQSERLWSENPAEYSIQYRHEPGVFGRWRRLR